MATLVEITAPGRPAPLWINVDNLLYADILMEEGKERLLLVFSNPSPLFFAGANRTGATSYILENPEDLAYAKTILQSLGLQQLVPKGPEPAKE